MAIILTQKRGYALIVSLIVMSVMLSFGLSLGALAYKQQILSSGAIESQYAFYAADAALECALYADQQNPETFDYASHSLIIHPGVITCNGVAATEVAGSYVYDSVSATPHLSVTDRVDLGVKQCADVTVYKYATGQTVIYSQGYDVSCAVVTTPGNQRIISRGVTSSRL